MIRFLNGDIFASKAGTLVNPVNCRGVSGAGLAKEFKRRYPHMYDEYRMYCHAEEFRVGRPMLLMGSADPHISILCFPTKDDWRDPSTLEIIEAGLKGLRDFGWTNFGTGIAFPALGCGLGGLEWSKVKPLFEKYLGDWPIEIEVYEPEGD